MVFGAPAQAPKHAAHTAKTDQDGALKDFHAREKFFEA